MIVSLSNWHRHFFFGIKKNQGFLCTYEVGRKDANIFLWIECSCNAYVYQQFLVQFFHFSRLLWYPVIKYMAVLCRFVCQGPLQWREKLYYITIHLNIMRLIGEKKKSNDFNNNPLPLLIKKGTKNTHIVVLISLTSLLATKQIRTVSYIRYFAGFFVKILFLIFSDFICHWLFFFLNSNFKIQCI